jgi:hypothetical protein
MSSSATLVKAWLVGSNSLDGLLDGLLSFREVMVPESPPSRYYTPRAVRLSSVVVSDEVYGPPNPPMVITDEFQYVGFERHLGRHVYRHAKTNAV